MAKIHGKKVYIAVGGSTIEGVMSTGVNQSNDTIEATTQDNASFKEFIAGDGEWDISVEGKFDSTHTYGETQLRTAMAAQAAVTVTWGEGLNTAGEQVLSGSAIITSLNTTAASGETKNFSATFKGTGTLTEGTTATTIL